MISHNECLIQKFPQNPKPRLCSCSKKLKGMALEISWNEMVRNFCSCHSTYSIGIFLLVWHQLQILIDQQPSQFMFYSRHTKKKNCWIPPINSSIDMTITEMLRHILASISSAGNYRVSQGWFNPGMWQVRYWNFMQINNYVWKQTYLPPMSAVQAIESEPCLCLSVCVCVCVCTLTAELFELWP